jgi:hypothetical protein
VLDERTMLEIARRHGVRCSAVTSIHETGGEARVHVIDDNLMLKVQRPHRLRPGTSLEKEAFFLDQLSAVQPDTLDFVGLTDFGDAYSSHPALDWHWPTHEDHVAGLQGYRDEKSATDEFTAARPA